MRSIFLLLFFPSLAFSASNHRYFRHIETDGRHTFKFRYEIFGKDTSRARCYRCTYNEHEKLIRWEFISAGRRQDDPSFELSALTISYGDNFERHTYYDSHDKPTLLSSTGEYAEQPTLSADKKTMTTFQYDRKGKLLKIDWNGCSRYLSELNSKGLMVNQYGLDDQGNKITDKEHHFRTSFQYDKNDRFVETTYYDSTDNKLSFVFYDFDRKGNLIQSKSNKEISQMKYDSLGYLIERNQYSKDMQLKKRTLYQYDFYGNLISQHIYGPDGTLDDAISIKDCRFDSLNHLLSLTKVNSEDKLKELVLFSYDHNGHRTEERITDGHMNLLENKDEGYSICRYIYDYDGHRIESRYLDSSGKLTGRKSDNIAIIKNIYDADGNIILEEYFDSKIHPIMSPEEGCAKVEYKFDENGEMTGSRKFNSNKEVIESWGSYGTKTTTTPDQNIPKLEELHNVGISFQYDTSKWTGEKSDNNEVDAVFVHDSKILFGAVSHENADLSFEEMIKILTSNITESDPAPVNFKVEHLHREGKDFVRFSFQKEVNGLTVLFFKDIYKTDKGYVGIVSWVYKSNYEKYKKDLEDFLACIKFR